MSTLFIHVGHGKTGSSYLQSILANSIGSLTEQGYVYPFSRDLSAAASGKISSGNAYEFDKSIAQGVVGEKVLFSGESFFHLLRGKNGLSLLEKIRNAGYEKVKILLFIRDPIDHAPSSYQQSIKRRGDFWSAADFFEKYSVPKLVAEFIEQLSFFEDFDLTIKNYSRCKKTILSEFCEWSDLSFDKLRAPEIKNVNRSLSKSELFFQKEINKQIGRSGSIVSNALCNELADINSDSVLPDVASQDKMLNRLLPYIEYVNKHVEPEHAYKVYSVEANDDEEENVFLEKSQLVLLASVLGGEIKRLRDKLDLK